jgi:cytochrome c peroxidase
MCQGTRKPGRGLLGICVTVLLIVGMVDAQEAGRGQSNYAPVDIKEDFATIMVRMTAAKAEVMQRQLDLLTERYDVSNRPAAPSHRHADAARRADPAPLWVAAGLTECEDFTEFEQRAAYFDGDPVIAQKKGVNILERGSQVHFMAEFQELLDFPPAPKLTVFGQLDPQQATEAEQRGQELFIGKAQCSTCHPPPYYTDNLMHNLRAERFYQPQMINGRMAAADGPIKTFPLRGIKDSPSYLHDGRLLTLEDTVEFFNLILGLKLTEPEKQDLVAFMRAL